MFDKKKLNAKKNSKLPGYYYTSYSQFIHEKCVNPATHHSTFKKMDKELCIIFIYNNITIQNLYRNK